jgi:hypothetical protein
MKKYALHVKRDLIFTLNKFLIFNIIKLVFLNALLDIILISIIDQIILQFNASNATLDVKHAQELDLSAISVLDI